MAYGFGNRTIRDGLVFYLDAANPSSYKSGSIIWKSIAKEPSTGEFVANTVFDNDYYNKKAIVFDGSDDKIFGTMGSENLLDIDTTGVITVQALFSIEALQNKKHIFSAGAEGTVVQYGIGITENGSEDILAYIFNHTTEESITTSTIIDNSRFPYRLLTVEFGTGNKVYLDETALSSGRTITHTTKPGNTWYVGNSPGGSDGISGGIQSIRIYNRTLSEQEISQIYQFYINR